MTGKLINFQGNILAFLICDHKERIKIIQDINNVQLNIFEVNTP